METSEKQSALSESAAWDKAAQQNKEPNTANHFPVWAT